MSGNNFNNKNVVITRPIERSQTLSDMILKKGGKPIIVPTLELQLVESKELVYIIENIETFDWIVFTSPAGVKSFFKLCKLDIIPSKIAVIGVKTEEELLKYGFKPDLIPKDFTAEGLLESFKSINLKNKNVALPRTLSAREVLPKCLEDYGASVLIAEAYTSGIPHDTTKIIELCNDIIDGLVDIITFTSPLTVKNLMEVYKNSQPSRLDELILALKNRVVVASIGPITAKALSEYGICTIEPSRYTVKDMVEAILQNI